MSWFTDLRASARLTRELRLTRRALESIAAALNRAYPPPAILDDPEREPAAVVVPPIDYGALFHLEQSMQRTLGRPPDAEELLDEYESRRSRSTS